MNFSKKLFISILTTALFFSITPLYAATPYGKGALLKGEFAEVFLVDEDDTLRWIPNEATFNALGYDWEEIIIVDNDVLYEYKFGNSLEALELDETQLTPEEIKAKISEVFANDPIMIDVAKCESGFRQFNNDGTVLTSSNGLYIGIFQIDPAIHAEYALSLGMDVYTIDGNIAYAKNLYDAQGPTPWPACSKKNAAAHEMLVSNLVLGDQNAEVKLLQQLLNEAGYTIAETGPGSPGKETDYFGSLTLVALHKFQCDHDVACDGTPETTGYGLVGPKTRAALQ